MTFTKNRLPERIKQVRGRARQIDFARKYGITQQVLSAWETGRTQPGADFIVAMCRGEGVSADYLLGLSDSPAPNS